MGHAATSLTVVIKLAQVNIRISPPPPRPQTRLQKGERLKVLIERPRIIGTVRPSRQAT